MRHTIKRVVLYVVLIVLAVIWLSPMISICLLYTSPSPRD